MLWWTERDSGFQCAVKKRLNSCQGMVAITVFPQGFCLPSEQEVHAESSSGGSFYRPMTDVTGAQSFTFLVFVSGLLFILFVAMSFLFPDFFIILFLVFVCVCVFVLYIHIWMNDYIVLLPSCFWICTGFVLFFFNTLIVKARIWIQEVSLGNTQKKKKSINGASWFVKFFLVTDLLSFEFTNLFLLL